MYILLSPLRVFGATLNDPSQKGPDGREVHLSATDFQKFIEKNTTKNVTFWYPANNPYLVSIQSVFLWGYSCLVCSGGPTFPELTMDIVKIVNSKTYLILMTENDNQIKQAFKSLTQIPISFELIKFKNTFT